MKTSVEIWQNIPEYEGLYQVSNLGNIKSLKYKGTNKEKLLKPTQSDTGYYYVNLYKNKRKKFYVHILVAVVFLNHIPCGHKLVINHKDFNKANNNIDNLEIVTNRENSNKKHLKTSSKYTGVCWCNIRKRWRAYIYIGTKRKNLGRFKEEIDASNAYQKALKTILS